MQTLAVQSCQVKPSIMNTTYYSVLKGIIEMPQFNSSGLQNQALLCYRQ